MKEPFEDHNNEKKLCEMLVFVIMICVQTWVGIGFIQQGKFIHKVSFAIKPKDYLLKSALLFPSKPGC